MRLPLRTWLLFALVLAATLASAWWLRSPWPGALVGLLLLTCAVLHDAFDRRDRSRARLALLRRLLSTDTGDGLLEGHIDFVRPQRLIGDLPDIFIETTPLHLGAKSDADTEALRATAEVLRQGETSLSEPASAVLLVGEPPLEAISLDGPLHVLMGDPDEGWKRNQPRRLVPGALVLARGRLVQEPHPDALTSTFRHTPMHRRLVPSVRGPGGRPVTMLLGVAPPRLIVARRGVLLCLLAWSLCLAWGAWVAEIASIRAYKDDLRHSLPESVSP